MLAWWCEGLGRQAAGGRAASTRLLTAHAAGTPTNIACLPLPTRKIPYLPPVDVPTQGNVCAAAAAATAAAGAPPPPFTSQVLHTYSQPVGPHIAAAQEGRMVTDQQLVSETRASLQAFAQGLARGTLACALVETAGGVNSPGPSGSLQVCKGKGGGTVCCGLQR